MGEVLLSRFSESSGNANVAFHYTVHRDITHNTSLYQYTCALTDSICIISAEDGDNNFIATAVVDCAMASRYSANMQCYISFNIMNISTRGFTVRALNWFNVLVILEIGGIKNS